MTISWHCSGSEAILLKAVEIQKISVFVEGKGNPCIYKMKSERGMVYVALNVDDNSMVEDIEVI